MDTDITQLAKMMRARRAAGVAPYTLLLGSSLSLTPAVRRAVCDSEDWINAIALSPDNHWLVTGSSDYTARLWKLRLNELVDLACRTAGRSLTRAEWEQYSPGQEYRKTCEQWPLEGE